MILQQFRLFPEHFTKSGQPKTKLFFDSKKREKNKKSKQNCNCSKNQIKIGINLTENYAQSCIISDRLTFRKNIEVDIIAFREAFERVVKENKTSNKSNIDNNTN